MPSDDPFHRVRRDFEALQIDEQAQFLIRASASTLARGIEQAGKALAAGLGETMHQACSPTPPHKDTPHKDAPGAKEPGPAEPETAQRQVPPERPDASDA
jgi:hypothetical protein